MLIYRANTENYIYFRNFCVTPQGKCFDFALFLFARCSFGWCFSWFGLVGFLLCDFGWRGLFGLWVVALVGVLVGLVWWSSCVVILGGVGCLAG